MNVCFISDFNFVLLVKCRLPRFDRLVHVVEAELEQLLGRHRLFDFDDRLVVVAIYHGCAH